VVQAVSRLPGSTLEATLKRKKPGWVRRLAWKVALAVAGLVVVGWGVREWLWPESAATVEITATATRATLPITVTERGELESSQSVDVVCEVEGQQNKIVTILPEGVRVKKDEVVVTFDTDQLKRNFDEQKVKYQNAEGKAKAAKSELEVQKNKAATDIDKAALDLTLAELDRDKYIEGDYTVALNKVNGEIELAKKEVQESQEKLNQFRKFVKQGFGTQESLRTMEFMHDSKKFMLTSKEAERDVLIRFDRKRKETELTAKARDARRALERAKATGQAAVDKAQSELDASEVAARLEKQSLDRLQKQLDHCVVKAPQEGILVYAKDRYWDPGSKVQPGGVVYYRQTLFSLPDLGKMQVKVKIHESMVKKTKPGQKAEIRVDAYHDAVLHGTVEKVATLADSMGPWDERGVKEYVTIVKIQDLPAEADLKPGMTAEVKILAKEIPNVLMVPVQAVGQQERLHYSYVVTLGGIEKREVKVGENNEKFVEVTEGLQEGEKCTLDARTRLAAEAKAKEKKPDSLVPTKEDTPQPAPATTPAAAPTAAPKAG
jgi:RND family efflux transporter MFP subunit